MIELRNISKSYKKTEAVKNISLSIEEGEIFGLLGPNGAGKSTTISMISTLFPPTSGTIYLEGKDIFKNPSIIRNILGVVPQEIALYPELTGYENLKFFGKIYGLKGKELEERIQEVLEIIGLNGRAKEQIKKYSGGMKRRVNIGCALLHQPRILIMDEPTVGIDPQSRNHILETVKELNKKGMTIIYTSHYMEEVEYLCDRIYIMDNGQVIAAGSKDELKASIAKEDTMEIVVDGLVTDLVEELKNVQEVYQAVAVERKIILTYEKGANILEDVFKKTAQQNIKILSMDVKSPTLEDVFLSLTGRNLRD